jgi:2-keto-3-deoxy-L-fuconate dehydrogenase
MSAAGNGEFAGLAAVVTGGGSGIGLATAQLLAERGARVACLDLDPSGVEAPLLGLTADVTDQDSVDAAVATAVERLGGLDILVNNAGIGAQGTVETNPLPEWQRVLDVNVLGIVRLSRAALPHLRRSRAAAIVNTCSIAATAGCRNGRSTAPARARCSRSRSRWRPTTSPTASASTA